LEDHGEEAGEDN